MLGYCEEEQCPPAGYGQNGEKTCKKVDERCRGREVTRRVLCCKGLYVRVPTLDGGGMRRRGNVLYSSSLSNLVVGWREGVDKDAVRVVCCEPDSPNTSTPRARCVKLEIFNSYILS
jgi:hypothetical protein